MVVVFPMITPEAIVTVGPAALITAAGELVGAARTAEMASSPRAMTFAEQKTVMVTRRRVYDFVTNK